MVFEEPEKPSKLKEKINNTNPNDLTPIDALNLIYELKEEAENE